MKNRNNTNMNTRAFAYALYMMISSYFMAVRDVMPEEVENIKREYLLDASERADYHIEEKCVSFVTEVVESVLPWNCYMMEADVCIWDLGNEQMCMIFQLKDRILEFVLNEDLCLVNEIREQLESCLEIEMCA